MVEEQKESNRNAAKTAAKAAAEKKQKKKKWCPIIAPELFQNKLIGESLLDDASQLMNKTVTVNMLQLLGDMKRQNVNIMFRVVDVKEGKGLAKAVKFEVSAQSIKRLAKRERDKITDSFVVKTKDGILVRIKPLLITNTLAKGGVKAALIRNLRGFSKEIINGMTFDQVLGELVSYTLQKRLKEALHTTYPLRSCDIRMLAIETKKKKESVEEELLLKMKKEKEAIEKSKLEEQEAVKPRTQADETYVDQSLEGRQDFDSEEPAAQISQADEVSDADSSDDDDTV